MLSRLHWQFRISGCLDIVVHFYVGNLGTSPKTKNGKKWEFFPSRGPPPPSLRMSSPPPYVSLLTVSLSGCTDHDLILEEMVMRPNHLSLTHPGIQSFQDD